MTGGWLLDKEFYMTPTFSVEALCMGEVDYSKMEYDFTDAPEPWKTFLTELFKDSNWTIQKQIEHGK